MPDVATARTRDVTVGATGTFGRDSAAVFNPLGTRRQWWTPQSTVTYWGVQVTAQITDFDPSGAYAPPILNGPDPGSQPAGTVPFWLTLVRGSAVKVYKFYVTVPTHFLWIGGTGSFSLADVVHCVQHVNPNPYEVRTVSSFNMSASGSVTILNTDTSTTTTTSSPSGTMSDTEATAAGIALGTPSDYDYIFSFSGIGVNFDLTAGISFSSPGLISAVTGIDTAWGKPRLTGTGASVTWHWNGTAANINPDWGGEPGYDQPSVAIQFYPSWAFSVASNVYHYADGSEVGAALQHYYGTDHVGDFTSGGAYRYPGTGLIDYVDLVFFDSGQQRDGFGFQSGSPLPTDANYDSLGGLTGSDYGPVGLLLQKPGDPVGAVTEFRFSPTWANGYATYIRAPLHPVPSPALMSKVLQPYQQGTLTWATTHRFTLFEQGGLSTALTAPTSFFDTDFHVVSSAGFAIGDTIQVGKPPTGPINYTVSGVSAGILSVASAISFSFATGDPVVKAGSRWASESSGPSFPGVTAPWDTSPTLSLVSGAGIDGNAFQVQSTGPASVGTALRYLLLHQGYRYAHFRVKASPPTTTLTANVSATDTDLPVASSAGFHIGDSVTLGAETLTISGVSTGHLTVSPLGTGHTSGAAVTRVTAGRVLFGLTGSSAGTVGWLVTPPLDGSWTTVDLDLAKPDYKLQGSAWVPASDLVPPSLFFPDGVPFGILGAQVTVYPLDAGTYGFDYLEGYYKTDGSRTPILFFPFLDGRGDLKAMGEYDDPDLINPDDGDPVQIMTWVVNGVRGASVAIFPGVQTSVTLAWQHLFDTLDTALKDTGISVVIGTAGDPDPLMVFLPLGAGKFDFLTGYGLEPSSGVAQVVHGQLRSSISAYYGAGDLMSATGGYGEEVVFHVDWLFDGEVIVSMTGDLSAPPVVTLADNDTGAAISSGSPDTDGMIRLPAKYGVVYPYDNTDGSAEWLAGPPGPPAPTAYTALGKLLNADWLKATKVSDPEDSSGYVELGSPLARISIVILDRYQNFLYLHGAGAFLGVCNLESHLGRYFVAYGDGASGIRMMRSESTTPPFSVNVLATTVPGDSEPCLLLLRGGNPAEPERLRLLYQRSGTVCARESDDGGETWGAEMPVTGGTHPRGCYGRAGERIEVAYVAGSLEATVQYPGDASPSSPVTLVDDTGTPLAVEDDTFDLDDAVEPEERVVMIVRIQGETSPSNWASAAYDYSTWERVD